MASLARHHAPSNPTRREFSAAALATAATSAATFTAGMVHSSRAAAEETRELRLGIIGCGGRGTGVLGRLAASTGQKVTRDFVAKESKLDLFPKDLTWRSALPSPGFAVPGKTKLV